jgi:hypothetical protein
MALSFEQFQQLRKKGLSNEQIINFESGLVPEKIEKPAEGKDSFLGKVFDVGTKVIKGVQTLSKPGGLLAYGAEKMAEGTVETTGKAFARPVVSAVRGVQGGTIEEQTKPALTPFGEVKPYGAFPGLAKKGEEISTKEMVYEGVDLLGIAMSAGFGTKSLTKVFEKIGTEYLPKLAQKFPKIAEKFSKEMKMAEYVAPKISSSEQQTVKGAKLIKERGMISRERQVLTKYDLENAKLAEEVGLEVGKKSENIIKLESGIEKEANALRDILRKTKSSFIDDSENLIKQLEEARKSKKLRIRLGSKDDVDQYDKIVEVFGEYLTEGMKEGKNFNEAVLDARIAVDKLIPPKIWEKAEGGTYEAVKAMRDTVKNYLNTKVGGDIVSQSLNKQHRFYDMMENIAAKSKSGTPLRKSRVEDLINKYWKQTVVGAAIAGGSTYGGSKLLD